MAIPYLLEGKIGEDGTYLRKDAGHFENLRIGLMSGRAQGVDTKAKQVRLEDGSSLPYDRLLIATGSRPTRLPVPGIDLPNVQACWTLEDARKIAEKTNVGGRVLQIGAGFIGCIILEALVSRGVHLTVVEAGDRMVPRMMTLGAGTMIKRWVESKGVRVVTNARVEAIEDGKDGAMRARLSTGEVIECDLIIAAAGVRPNIEFLRGSGIGTDIGVLVDERMQTSDPDVFAAGDVAEGIEFSSGKRLVNAIQPNAAEQARIAALNMVGKGPTSQGTMAINVLDTLGLISSSFGAWEGVEGGQSVEIVDQDQFRYLSLQFKGDVLIGATSIGLTEHVGVLRGLIQTRTRLGEWKDELLRDPMRIKEAYLARASAQASGV
jgi:NAD(P)H-nitrite reductase large subunit